MAKVHDKAINRLVMILQKLSQDERHTLEEFAEEFGVDKRTIYRDINERLYDFPIVKDSLKRYKFDNGFGLDKSVLESDEMLHLMLGLSQISSINDAFNKKSSRIISKLLVSGMNSPYYIKPELFEAIDTDSNLMNAIEDAIKQKRISTIVYKSKSYAVEPMKIASFDGLWYLFARECSSMKIRTFQATNISKITMKHETFETHGLEDVLKNVHSAWFEDGACFEVKIKVDNAISDYFRRKKHLTTQVILKEFEDGSLIVLFEVSSDEDIDNLIKAWLPHIEIISPTRLRTKVINELKEYLLQLEQGMSHSL